MIDIVIALIFGIFIFLGYRTGLLRSVFRVVAFILSLIIAYYLYTYLRDIIAIGSIGDSIRQLVKTKFVDPQIASNSLNQNALPEYMQSMVVMGQVELSDAYASFISNLVINILSFLAVFIITRLLISIIGFIVKFVSRLPIIRFFDKIGGVIFGVLESVLILYIAFALIYAITPLRDNPQTQTYISESVLAKTMYENNPLVDMVMPKNYDILTN